MSRICYADLWGRVVWFESGSALRWEPQRGALGAVTVDGLGDPRALSECLYLTRGARWVRVASVAVVGGRVVGVEVTATAARRWLARLGFDEESEMKRARQVRVRGR